MKKIPLTKNKEAIVDSDDYDYLNNWKWSYVAAGYAIRGQQRNNKIKYYLMHRVILKAKDNQEVDHINGNRLDNRKENLRFVSRQQNQWNRTKSLNKSSKYKGVNFHKKSNKWMARIRLNNKEIYLGIFKQEKDAARAYNKKAIELFGEYAKLNEL